MEIAQKSTLAKLLAAENISVEHRKVSTAAFDLKSRKIILPIWKTMDNDLYDMLIGHEVGHALYTPLEGWHDEVSEKGQGFKSFLNVIEDARIERKIKDKFPGLVRNFYKGYQNLYANDFFGIKGRDIDALPLIDRINLHYKIGSMAGINFTAEEQSYINRIDLAETWEDVMAIANDLFEYSKEEPEMQDMLDDLQYSDEYDDEDEEDNDMSSGAGDDDEDEDEEEQEEANDSSGTAPRSNTDEKEEVEDESAPQEQGESKTPQSFTDQNFRESEDRLLDKGADDILYAKFPKMNIKRCVMPIKDVWDTEFEGVFKPTYHSEEDIPWTEIADEAWSEFNLKNASYINTLVQQFEMKRKASEFAKARQNKTGKLNVDKLWATRLTEDVFLSNTVVPKGKNHGMMMFIDFSGSMNQDLESTIEQTLIQISFCKKVNIPFDVYSFTTSSKGICKPGESYRESLAIANNGFEPGKLAMVKEDLQINHLMSSSLDAATYKKVFRKMLTLAKAMAPRSWHRGPESINERYIGRYHLPDQLGLGGTPLAETTLVARDLIKEFRNKHNVEVMNVIFLTDGDATGELEVPDGQSLRKVGSIAITEGAVTTEYKFRDLFWARYGGDVWYRAVLKHLKNTVDCNLINLHIGSFKRRDLMDMFITAPDYEYSKFEEKYKKEWTANKFFELENFKEFDVMYAIKNGNNLKVDDEGLTVKSDSKSDVLRGFKKFQKNKTTSRVFLNRFIDKVA